MELEEYENDLKQRTPEGMNWELTSEFEGLYKECHSLMEDIKKDPGAGGLPRKCLGLLRWADFDARPCETGPSPAGRSAVPAAARQGSGGNPGHADLPARAVMGGWGGGRTQNRTEKEMHAHTHARARARARTYTRARTCARTQTNTKAPPTRAHAPLSFSSSLPAYSRG